MTLKSRLLIGALLLLVIIGAMAALGITNTSGNVRLALSVLCIIAVIAVVAIWALTANAITRPLGAAISHANRVAAGDLTLSIQAMERGEFGRLMQALKAMDENLVRMVNDIRSGAEAIVTSANEVATGNSNLSKRTEMQASTLEETASSMSSLTSAVRQNTENARKANELAKNANAVAASGGVVVGEVVTTMNDIHDSSRKIADIISVIDSIAFQTNILALNAAVEAARAGEQGRGFAVVASEVRGLAQRSADAAKEIKGLISTSVDKVEAGTRLVENAGKTMDEIVVSVAKVTQIMDQISTASSEQSSGIEQVNQAIGQMEQVVQQNAAVVEQASAAADSMRMQAHRLQEVAGVFKLNENQATQLNRRRDRERDPTSPVAPRPGPAATVTPVAITEDATRKPAAPALPPRANDDGDWKEF